MKKALITLLTLALTFIAAPAADKAKPSSGKKEVLLVDLTPENTEWGTEKWDVYPDMPFGERIADYGGGWPRVPPFWEGEMKVIKEYPKDFKVPEGQAYRSIQQEYFASGGELITGVGLFSRRTQFYHWIEYKIPEGATAFDAKLYVADDITGGWGNGNDQWFVFRILIDDQTVIDLPRSRGAPEDGSGELLDTISLKIPAGAKRIRFFVQNIAAGNGNANTELILNDAKFILK